MTATTAPARSADLPGVTFGGILRSEWIKQVTLRSTLWCYAILVALTIGLGLLVAAASVDLPAELGVEARQSAWLFAATFGVNFSQLVIAVLGALVITGEYGTGMIRSTFAAVPTRIPALLGKAAVFAALTFVVSLVALAFTALATYGVLAGAGIAVEFADAQVWIGLVGAAGYLALIGLLALAIGTVIRNSAGAIATVLGLLLVLPTILQLFAAFTAAEWAIDLARFLPSDAGGRMFTYPTTPFDAGPVPPGVFEPITLEPWQGLLVVVAWVVVIGIGGAILLKRRDA